MIGHNCQWFDDFQCLFYICVTEPIAGTSTALAWNEVILSNLSSVLSNNPSELRQYQVVTWHQTPNVVAK